MASPMKVNWSLLQQVVFDTHEITQSVSIVAEAKKSGGYAGRAENQSGKQSHFSVVVGDHEPYPAVDIDLGNPGLDGRTFRLKSGGYVQMFSSSPTDTYKCAVQNGADLLVDNRHLVAGNIVVIMALRPGVYVVRDAPNDATAEIRVKYPDPKAKHRPLVATEYTQPAEIRISPGKMDPAKLDIIPGQPVLFHVIDGSHVVAELFAETISTEKGLVDRKRS